MGDKPLSFAFSQLYHTYSMKNRLVSDFLVWLENSISFYFGFSRSLSNTKTTKVAFLLSLIDDFNFRLGRQDVRVWCPNPLEGLSCKSLFRILLDPSPIVESIFDVL